jgi:hypothetical protein
MASAVAEAEMSCLDTASTIGPSQALDSGWPGDCGSRRRRS